MYKVPILLAKVLSKAPFRELKIVLSLTAVVLVPGQNLALRGWIGTLSSLPSIKVVNRSHGIHNLLDGQFFHQVEIPKDLSLRLPVGGRHGCTPTLLPWLHRSASKGDE